MNTIAINNAIPEITFNSTLGLEQKLSAFRGKFVVFYFYPKDNTSACTLEAEQFRDHFKQFQQKNTIIFGISRDTLTSHKKFAEKLQLPFALISDKDEKLCQLFNVIKPKTMYGKPVRGIERSTFLIDPQGKLRHEWRGIKVDGHIAEVLNSINN